MPRRVLVWFLLLLGCLPASRVRAVVWNWDKATIAAMETAYASQGALEKEYTEAVERILSKYALSLGESTVIYLSKQMENRAKTILGKWGEEKTAYKRMFFLVANCIVPKTVTVAQLMMHYPDNALYWISYLLRITNDTKQWCMMFQNVVVNSKFDFKQAGLLALNEGVLRVFDNAVKQIRMIDAILGIVNLVKHPEALGAAGRDFLTAGTSNMAGMITTLINGMGGTIAQRVDSITMRADSTKARKGALAGLPDAGKAVPGITNPFGSWKALFDTAKDLGDIVKTGFAAYKLVRDNFVSEFKGMMKNFDVRNQDNVRRFLFQSVNYANEMAAMESRDQYGSVDRYFTLTYRIVYSDTAEWREIYRWEPEYKGYTGNWVLMATDDKPYPPVYGTSSTSTAWSAASAAFEGEGKKAGCAYNSADVAALNASGRTLRLDYTHHQYERPVTDSAGNSGYGHDGSQGGSSMGDGFRGSGDGIPGASGVKYEHLVACGCVVSEGTAPKVVVYEEVYNSYDMDLNGFLQMLQSRCEGYNDREDGHTYYIECDDKVEYDLPDENKVAQAEACQVYVTCTDSYSLMEGIETYKCGRMPCKKNGSYTPKPECRDHSLNCQQYIEDEDPDFTRLKDGLPGMKQAIEDQKAKIRLVEDRMAQSGDDTSALAEELKDMKEELERMEKEYADAEHAYGEMLADDPRNKAKENVSIPMIMRMLQNNLNIEWTDAGGWQGFTYVRHAVYKGGDGKSGRITFKADLKVQKPARKFLFWWVNRPHMKIDYKLTNNLTERSLVSTFTRGKDATEDQWTRQVRDSVASLAGCFPDCKVETQLLGKTQEEDPDNKVKHLLWSSERLEVAQMLESQLVRIYAQLVSLEKFLHYRHNIVDVLLKAVPRPEVDSIRRATVYRQALARWKARAQNASDGSSKGRQDGGQTTPPASKP